MLRCSRCGNDNEITARFCVSCGHGLQAAPTALPNPSAETFAFAETAAGEHPFTGPIPGDARRAAPLPPDVPGESPQPPAGPPLSDPLSLPADAPRVLCGFLVGYETNALGQFWPLYQGRNLVGRLGAMAGADVEIPHPTVSSRHATIFSTAPPCRAFLVDSGSTNGCFVNDSPLQANAPRELRDGDRVRFGLYNMIVKTI